MRGRRMALMILVLVLAGCAGGAGAGGATGPEVKPEWTSCADAVPDSAALASADALELPRLGQDFRPVSAVVCASVFVRRSDGGEDLVATEGRTHDIDALLAALALPDEPLTGGACTADLPLIPWFALLDGAGQWVRPGVPRDGCGKIRIEVRDALTALKLTTVATRVLREVESAQAAATGCSQQWADMIWVETTEPGGRGFAAPSGSALPASGQVRLCVYAVSVSEQGSGKPAGEFVHGGVLTPAQWKEVRAAILAGQPAPECTEPAGRFALLRSVAGTGGEVYVELDGCQRLMVVPASGGPMLAQATPGLIALLDP